MTTPTTTWEALHRAHVTLTRQFQNRPEFRPVSFREYDALDVLSRAGDDGMRLNQLNTYVALTQSSLSRMTERLEGRGLLHRWQDPDDGRGLRLRLTDDGQALHTTISAAHHAHVQDAMSALTPEELDTFTRLADKLRGVTP